ncbi:MAG: hypothetical protein WBG71_09905 [Leeuwenhoekiella sp.]
MNPDPFDQNFKRWKAFIFGLLKHLTLRSSVTFYLGEIYALLLVFLSPKSIKNSWNDKPARLIVLILSGYIITQLVSDLVINRVDHADLIRGLANTGMAAVLFVYLLSQFAKGLHLIWLILLGESISLLVSVFFSETPLSEINEIFKSIVSPALHNLMLITGFIALRKSFALWKLSVIFLIYGLLTIYFDARWYGLSFVILSIGIVFKDVFVRLSIIKKMISVLVVFGIGALLMVGYVSAVMSGNLNNSRIQRQLHLVENPYNPVQVLKIGRAETYIAVQAILKKPWLGYGDWARDPEGVYYTKYLELRGYGNVVEEYPDYIKNQTIPNHSVLFGAWLYTGIMGFFAMVVLLVLLVHKSIRVLMSGTLVNHPLQLITLYFLINGVWVFFFSPIQHLRHTVVFYLAFLLVQEQQCFFGQNSINSVDEA